MDIVTFLKKDIDIFLENVVTYGTSENKAVEDEISNLLNITSTKDSPVSKDSKIENIIAKEKQTPISKIKVESKPAVTEIKTEKIEIKTNSPVIKENLKSNLAKKQVQEAITSVVKKTANSDFKMEPVSSKPSSSVPKEVSLENLKDELQEEVKEEKEKFKKESDEIKQELRDELKKDLNEEKRKIEIRELELAEFEEENKEILDQLSELKSHMEKGSIKKVLQLYHHLKLLISTITLSDKLRKYILKSLNETAHFLVEKKKQIDKTSEINDKSKDDYSLDEYEKNQNGNNMVSKKETFSMPDYVAALRAIKETDKLTALELLVALSKKYPKNLAIKTRLREALSL